MSKARKCVQLQNESHLITKAFVWSLVEMWGSSGGGFVLPYLVSDRLFLFEVKFTFTRPSWPHLNLHIARLLLLEIHENEFKKSEENTEDVGV